jgi:hypothetical protein
MVPSPPFGLLGASWGGGVGGSGDFDVVGTRFWRGSGSSSESVSDAVASSSGPGSGSGSNGNGTGDEDGIFGLGLGFGGDFLLASSDLSLGGVSSR